MDLGKLRALFAHLLVSLLEFAWANGFEVYIEEVKRDPRVAQLNAQSGAGIAHSLHIDGLAVDLTLLRGGTVLTQTKDHQTLGAFWKSLHPLCRWGGDFGDGNHYSITYQGRK